MNLIFFIVIENFYSAAVVRAGNNIRNDIIRKNYYQNTDIKIMKSLQLASTDIITKYKNVLEFHFYSH